MSDAWLVKRCGACRTLKPLGEFHRYGKGYQPWCRPCRKVYDAAYHQRVRPKRIQQKNLRQREKQEWYRELKTRPCTDCGASFHPAAMEWDHLPGSIKLEELSNMVTHAGKNKILAEMAKCELVFANCHAMRTWRRLTERR